MGSQILMRALLYLGLGALFLLHNDWWLWTSDARFLRLPAGLAYHLIYCLVVVVWMTLLVRHAWPRGVGDDVEPSPGGDDA